MKKIVSIISLLLLIQLISCTANTANQEVLNNELRKESVDQVHVEMSEDQSIVKIYSNEDNSKDITRDEYIENYEMIDIDALHDEVYFEPYGESWKTTLDYMRDFYSLVIRDEKILLESMVLILNDQENRAYIYSKVVDDYEIDLLEYREEIYREIGAKFPVEFIQSKFPIIKESPLTFDKIKIKTINFTNQTIVGVLEEDYGPMYMIALIKFNLSNDVQILFEDKSIEFEDLQEGMEIMVHNDSTILEDKGKSFQITHINVYEEN